MADDKPTTEAWTVGRLLTWTTDFLRGKGADSPRLDAEVLLAHARGCQRIELYTAFEEEPTEAVRTAFRELVGRRAKGTPVAYLVGRREFFSLMFEVTSDVLIPRPETESLVVRAIDLAKLLKTESLHIADVGTGSGIIAITVAKHIKNCRVTAIDISPAALVVAKRNATKHGVAERIVFVESDLFEAVPREAKFDLVLSNPPYVALAEMAELAPDVRDHEPYLALDGGANGTEVIERLIPQTEEKLKSGGWLLMEVGSGNAARVEQLVKANPAFELAETIKDIANLPRVVQAKRK
ncbi:MAG: peptide chain release factor N(5)-glutamine methyltransferase [Bythopirellula sp.]|nr:peptide chain release factor N(5)-glutamine methyltransferase [Bythopirellula sp.]